MKKNKNKRSCFDSLNSGKAGNNQAHKDTFFYNAKSLRQTVRPILFSKGKIRECFFTDDSGFYLTPQETIFVRNGGFLNKKTNHWDGVVPRAFSAYKKVCPRRRDVLVRSFEIRYSRLQGDLAQGYSGFLKSFSLPKLWNASIVGAMLVGMVSMTFIYRYLGEGVSAGEKKAGVAVISQNVEEVSEDKNGKVLGVETEKKKTEKNDTKEKNDKEADYIGDMIEELKDKKKEELESQIRSMVKGYPIEKMVPYIAEKDRVVAAFIIGIGKKESNWGKRVPVLNGQDCYNYWGYRGIRDRMGTGGHTCFDSPKDAVDTVAKRIEFLVSNKKLNTPEKMVIWKCGSDCAATGGHAAARKWISDVSLYFNKLNKDN